MKGMKKYLEKNIDCNEIELEIPAVSFEIEILVYSPLIIKTSGATGSEWVNYRMRESVICPPTWYVNEESDPLGLQ